MFSLTRGFRRKVTASPKKRDGSTALLDGALDGKTIIGDVTVTPVEGDPLSVHVNGLGEVGASRIVIFADARLGPERREISMEYDVEVIDEEASNLGLVIGEEEALP